MAEQKTFNFYGIRKTSNPDYYSVTLCAGKGDKREWAYLKLKPLENKKQEEKQDDLPF